jgi:ABC-type multidrug transport system ATPase subunit
VIGPHRLRYDGSDLVESIDDGDVEFGASHLAVAVAHDRLLLDDVSFTLPPRTLMAVVGPSGAGKSTLLGALTGARPATSGAVVYAGRSLYGDYDELRQRIGFVPQQDILHQTLTIRQALEFGAALRFPADTSPAERTERVLHVAEELRLSDRLDTRINRLSGGERKRASTAMELLTKPSLLFLDEPTSGLDADLDRDVMQQLRSLADGGRTVIVITHNLEHLDMCDLVLVLARGGNLAYLGPPGDVRPYFGAGVWADVFSTLRGRPGSEWAALLRSRSGNDPWAAPMELPAEGAPVVALPPIRRQQPKAQFAILTRRYVAVTAADRALVAILALLPVVLALIARIVPAEHGLALMPGNGDARQLLLVLVIGACLMGTASAVRELVKERVIYQRERAVGLSSGAYLASKVAVLGTLAVVQATVLTVLSLAGRPGPSHASLLPSSTGEIALAVAMASLASTALGLLLSSVVRDENQAMPLLVLATMAQLVLCGALVPMVGRPGLEQFSWLFPARWAMAATASTVDLPAMAVPPPVPADPSWQHGGAIWLGDIVVLIAMATGAIGLVTLALGRLDPKALRTARDRHTP